MSTELLLNERCSIGDDCVEGAECDIGQSGLCSTSSSFFQSNSVSFCLSASLSVYIHLTLSLSHFFQSLFCVNLSTYFPFLFLLSFIIPLSNSPLISYLFIVLSVFSFLSLKSSVTVEKKEKRNFLCFMRFGPMRSYHKKLSGSVVQRLTSCIRR